MVDAVAPVASAVPLPSKSHEYVQRVAVGVGGRRRRSATASGAKPDVGVAVAEVITGAVFAPLPPQPVEPLTLK